MLGVTQFQLLLEEEVLVNSLGRNLFFFLLFGWDTYTLNCVAVFRIRARDSVTAR